MLVGPAGAGKSAVAECLAAALTDLGTKHVIWRMNPKVTCLTEPALSSMSSKNVQGMMTSVGSP